MGKLIRGYFGREPRRKKESGKKMGQNRKPAAGTPARRGQEAFSRGCELERAQNLEAAEQAFRVAARHRPKWAAAYIRRGIVLAHLGRHAEAYDELRKAERLRPKDVKIKLELGLEAYELREWKKGQQCFAEALKLTKGHPLVLGAIGLTETYFGNTETALFYLRRAAGHPLFGTLARKVQKRIMEYLHELGH